MYRDYGPKEVKFFFIYKSLAHPELAGNYVQPFTLSERLDHARQAERQLGASIPWIVDAMDNRLKHALGDRPNSEFIVNPEGIIIRKRAWSDPAEVRKDLEELVGPVDRITREEDVQLKLELPPKATAAIRIMPRLNRPKMQPIMLEPQIEPEGPPFFAKLRAEADAGLLKDGTGKLYLGFHLDPFHNAHWNNLTEPLSFRIETVEGVTIDKWEAVAPKVSVASDADPREFMLKVAAWPGDKPLRLTVSYFACVGEESCYTVTQAYVLHRERDIDGGGARGEGAGYWESEEFAQRMLASDKDNDGKLAKSEATGIIAPQFNKLDRNKDGFLDLDELEVFSDWLNYHHQPGVPSSESETTQ